MDRRGSLAGLRAVVTGSSSGIGRAIAVRLAQEGAAVVVHANRSIALAAALARELREGGCRAESMQADLLHPPACAGLVQSARDLLGGLDVWVNNAGADILTGEGRKLDFEAKLDLLLKIDVRATMLLTREVGGHMRAAGGGSIINIGWDQAETGMEGDSGELFAAAKGAILSFTRSAALSLAPAVRVNCVAPGWIRTAWGEGASAAWQERVLRETPLERWGAPGDVAEAVRFLASREAAFVTGQILRVNGGAVR